MEVRVDGNRSSSENWMVAQTAPAKELPALTPEQQKFAVKFGMSNDVFARRLLAEELGRKDLERRAEQAAQLIERLASNKGIALRVDHVWVKTIEGKLRFDVESSGRHALILVSEELIDELFESGSLSAEESISRIIDVSLPVSWMAQAS